MYTGVSGSVQLFGARRGNRALQPLRSSPIQAPGNCVAPHKVDLMTIMQVLLPLLCVSLCASLTLHAQQGISPLQTDAYPAVVPSILLLAGENTDRIPSLFAPIDPLSTNVPLLPHIDGRKQKVARRIVFPIIGAAVGAIAGYVVYDKFYRVPTDEDWGIGYYLAVTVGATTGAVAGGVIEKVTRHEHGTSPSIIIEQP